MKITMRKQTKIAIALTNLVLSLDLSAENKTIDGVVWTYTRPDSYVSIGSGSYEYTAIPSSTSGTINVPSEIDTLPVRRIAPYSFFRCQNISSVTIPESVTNIGMLAFYECCSLGVITLTDSIKEIESNAFSGTKIKGINLPSGIASLNQTFIGCAELETIVIPSNITWIGDSTFLNCTALKSVKILGNYVHFGDCCFDNCENLESIELPATVQNNWYGGSSLFRGCTSLTNVVLPNNLEVIKSGAFASCSSLKSIYIPMSVTNIQDGAFDNCTALSTIYTDAGNIGHAEEMILDSGFKTGKLKFETLGGFDAEKDDSKYVYLTVTNVVLHYVINSITPKLTTPVSEDTGFVNIITEVKSGGAVSVPSSWATNYPAFAATYGDDFTKALMKTTGKTDGAGNAMCVWQDYVAGTDPTDENDKFTASITIVDGVPVISYTPELTAEQANLRVYKTYGKMKLTDTAWTDITAKTGEERANYNFFKVTVEMK